MTGRLKNESGFALILTLVVTALMVAVVVEMIHQVYVDTSLSRGFRDGQQASILAESGAMGGAKLLQMGLSGRSYTSLTDRWATPIKLDDDAGSLVITISEESGKININGLANKGDDFTQKALLLLGKRLQLSGNENVWRSVAAWILPKSVGAESPYYRNLKSPYNARNSKMLTVTELSLVEGITPEIFGKLRPFLTVFYDQANSPVPTININTAPKEVLTALDERIDDRMAERIMEERSLRPFKLSTGELSRVPGLDPGVVSRLSGSAYLSFKGNLFRITSVAKVKDSGRTVEAVVRLSGNSLDCLSWQEY